MNLQNDIQRNCNNFHIDCRSNSKMIGIWRMRKTKRQSPYCNVTYINLYVYKYIEYF